MAKGLMSSCIDTYECEIRNSLHNICDILYSKFLTDLAVNRQVKKRQDKETFMVEFVGTACKEAPKSAKNSYRFQYFPLLLVSQ